MPVLGRNSKAHSGAVGLLHPCRCKHILGRFIYKSPFEGGLPTREVARLAPGGQGFHFFATRFFCAKTKYLSRLCSGVIFSSFFVFTPFPFEMDILPWSY